MYYVCIAQRVLSWAHCQCVNGHNTQKKQRITDRQNLGAASCAWILHHWLLRRWLLRRWLPSRPTTGFPSTHCSATQSSANQTNATTSHSSRLPWDVTQNLFQNLVVPVGVPFGVNLLACGQRQRLDEGERESRICPQPRPHVQSICWPRKPKASRRHAQ